MASRKLPDPREPQVHAEPEKRSLGARLQRLTKKERLSLLLIRMFTTLYRPASRAVLDARISAEILFSLPIFAIME